MTSVPLLNEMDQKIRKKWLNVSYLMWIIYPLLAVGAELFLFNQGEMLDSLVITIFLSAYLLNLGVFYLLYHFAYKKFGTKWLTFVLCGGLVSISKGIFEVIHEPTDFLTIGLMVVNVPLYFWWFFRSVYLRNLNKKIQFQMKFPTDYEKCIQLINDSTSLENLNLNFAELTKIWPKFNSFLAEIYQAKKKMLIAKQN